MAVFYKYVDRQVSDQINWADISKSLSQTFDAEREAREKKKAEIDQASIDYIEKLQSQPQTESKGLNERLGQFTSDASSMSKTMLDDLKAGRITLKDYTIRTQNLKSDTNQALDLIQTYGKRYSEVMKGIKDGEKSAAQADFMARFEGFANLKNNKLYIEPTSGRIYAADEITDPITGVKTMGNNIQNVAALKQMMEQDIPRINLDNLINERADKIGGFITSAIKSAGMDLIGKEVKFKDATQQQFYDRYLKDLTDEFAGGVNNPNTISFFVDNVRVSPPKYDEKGNIVKEGVPYKLIYSEADRKSEGDLLVKEGDGGVYFAVPTKEQMDAAYEHIKVTMRQKLEKAEEQNAFTRPERRPKSEQDIKDEKIKREEKDKMSYIMQLAFPTSQTSRQAALNYINSIQPKDENSIPVVYSFTGNGDLFATYNNDPNNTRVFKISDDMTKDQWAAATREIHGISDVGRVLRENTFPTSKKPSRPEAGTVTSGIVKVSDVEVMNRVVNGIRKLKKSEVGAGQTFDAENEDVIVSHFSEALSPYGFGVSGGGRSGGDYIKIYNASDPEKTITINVDGYTDRYDDIMKQVKAFVTNASNIDKKAVKDAEKARQGSSVPGGNSR